MAANRGAPAPASEQGGGGRKSVVTLDGAQELARELASTVKASGWKPDLLVGIANGGVHPAFFTAQALDIPVSYFRVQRRTSQLKQRLGFAGKALSSKLLKRPLYILNRYADRWLGGVASAGVSLKEDVREKRVLIVDDCVDSGASVAHVRSLLQRAGAGEIKLAVFCWTTKYDSRALHGVVPDFYLGRKLPSYPWSADNADYAAFKLWLNERLKSVAEPTPSL